MIETFGCDKCGVESDEPLNLLDGRLVGPITTLRIRSTRGEHNQRALVFTCQNCGLMTFYDADSVQGEFDSTQTPS